MSTVEKINNPIKIDLQLKAWELAALLLSGLVFAAMTAALVSDFSVRRILWPSPGEGHLARPIGKVTFTLNKTLRQGREQPDFAAIAQNDAVYPLDTIMAGPGSALKITLDDNSVLEIGENSMIRLNFDSSLQLSGINRETVIEVVAGTVAAKGGEQSQVKIKSENRTFLATRDKQLELSREGGKLATLEGQNVDLVAQAKQSAKMSETKIIADAKALSEARTAFSKLGGVMTAQTTRATSVSDIYGSLKNAKKPAAAALPAGGGSLGESAARDQAKVAMNTKVADEMMGSTILGKNSASRTKQEQAKAFEISPADNFSVKTKGKAASLEFPIELKWKADPDNASFLVRFTVKGFPDDVVKAKADDGEVKLTYSLKHPGDYTWKIEDYGGAVLSVRSIHVNSKFEAIALAEPVLVGRERGTKMWQAQAKWGFLFKWKPVKGVKQYKVRITRNISSEDGATPLAEHMTTENEFILPYNKEWQAEHMFFSVEAIHPGGFQLASNYVPFIFAFLPPKPRVPANKKEVNRSRLVEGVLNLNWEANSDADKFTLQISKDPNFQDKIEDSQVSENEFRFYPPDTGKYYWRVRGDKDSISSPYSETWEFTVK